MFNPQYRLLISEKCFPLDRFICLGSQLMLIINFLKNIIPMHTWYGMDVEATGKGANDLDIEGCRLNHIGTDMQLVRYCSKITQFMKGVFLCIDVNYSFSDLQNVELETEDEPFRPISCDGILVEIRTFDTSYFEIYSENEKIVQNLSEKFCFSELSVNID